MIVVATVKFEGLEVTLAADAQLQADGGVDFVGNVPMVLRPEGFEWGFLSLGQMEKAWKSLLDAAEADLAKHRRALPYVLPEVMEAA